MLRFPPQARGFTLVELLLVVAIIGILSSIVLSSLSNARDKGNDASVKSNLVGTRAQAELFAAANSGSYMGAANTVTDVCASGGLVGGTRGIYQQVLAAAKASLGSSATVGNTSTASTYSTAVCHSAANAWAAWVPLSDSASGAPVGFCVDSSSTAKRTTTVLAANATVCP